MRSIVALSSERTIRFSEPTSASATWSRRSRQLCRGHPDARRELLAGGLAFVHRQEALACGVDRALVAAQRARRPVVPAQLVEHRAVDPRPRVLLERRALVGVVALDRADQRLQAARQEVIDVALGRHLADLAVDDVANHRHEREDQPVAQLAISGELVLVPGGEHLCRRRSGCTLSDDFHAPALISRELQATTGMAHPLRHVCSRPSACGGVTGYDRHSIRGRDHIPCSGRTYRSHTRARARRGSTPLRDCVPRPITRSGNAQRRDRLSLEGQCRTGR